MKRRGQVVDLMVLDTEQPVPNLKYPAVRNMRLDGQQICSQQPLLLPDITLDLLDTSEDILPVTESIPML